MKRRDFFKGIGGVATSAGMSLLAGGCQAAGPYDHLEDTDPRAGFNLVPPSLFLFLDRRYIDPGELIWRHPEGEILDLYKPEGKPVEARSDPDITPRGHLRIRAMPATREILEPSPPYNIIYDDGMYKAWSLRRIEGATLEDSRIGISYRQSKDGYEWKDSGRVDVIDAPGLAGGGESGFFIDEHGPAPERYKAIVSVNVKVTGKRLRINARIRGAGEIRVGLAGIPGRNVDNCDVLQGDKADHMVSWNGDPSLNVEPGNSVRLHFTMNCAELFSFAWV